MQAVFVYFSGERCSIYFCKYFLVRGIMDKIGFEGSYFYGCKRRKMLIDLTSAKGIAGNEDEVRSLFKSMQHRMRINFI